MKFILIYNIKILKYNNYIIITIINCLIIVVIFSNYMNTNKNHNYNNI